MAGPGRSSIIVVTGPPASGKTTLAARLGSDLSVPVITKDGIKEALLDVFGSVDREASERIGQGSWEVLWHLLEVEVAARRSAIFEGNFSPEHAGGRLVRLGERFDLSMLQIHCSAEEEVLYERYRRRIDERHPGHVDGERLADPRGVFDPGRYLLDVPCELIRLDTTSFDDVAYVAVCEAATRHVMQ